MFTARNFSKINKNILHLFPKKFNKKTTTPQIKDCAIKDCAIKESTTKNYKSHPDFNIKIIFRQCQSKQYVDDLVMRSSMMI